MHWTSAVGKEKMQFAGRVGRKKQEQEAGMQPSEKRQNQMPRNKIRGGNKSEKRQVEGFSARDGEFFLCRSPARRMTSSPAALALTLA